MTANCTSGAGARIIDYGAVSADLLPIIHDFGPAIISPWKPHQALQMRLLKRPRQVLTRTLCKPKDLPEGEVTDEAWTRAAHTAREGPKTKQGGIKANMLATELGLDEALTDIGGEVANWSARLERAFEGRTYTPGGKPSRGQEQVIKTQPLLCKKPRAAWGRDRLGTLLSTVTAAMGLLHLLRHKNKGKEQCIALGRRIAECAPKLEEAIENRRNQTTASKSEKNPACAALEALRPHLKTLSLAVGVTLPVLSLWGALSQRAEHAHARDVLGQARRSFRQWFLRVMKEALAPPPLVEETGGRTRPTRSHILRRRLDN